MPKEVIEEGMGGNAHIEVRWGDLYNGYVGVGIDRGDEFQFVHGSEVDAQGEPVRYTGLHLVFDSEEQITDLIKALRKAKRKTF